MVVVRVGKGYCVCIQVNTYAGRGLEKFKNSDADVQAHSIIHMDGTEAVWLSKEPRSKKNPIVVRHGAEETKLDRASRLCYSKPHTVEHNLKTLEVGLIEGRCLGDVLRYYAEQQNLMPPTTNSMEAMPTE